MDENIKIPSQLICDAMKLVTDTIDIIRELVIADSDDGLKKMQKVSHLVCLYVMATHPEFKWDEWDDFKKLDQLSSLCRYPAESKRSMKMLLR
jgi:hypothetical protein